MAIEARLVEIAGSRRGATTPLEGPELTIGRDPTSGLILDFARVSRHHAVIRELGDRHTVADAGSTNGTTVSGRPVDQSPLLLKPGDVIELAGEVALLYETGPFRSTAPWVAAAAAMVAMLVAAIALAVFYRPVENDPTFEEALELARDGRRAARNGDPLLAKESLRTAAGLLFREGYLDDVQRADVMRVAMERLGEKLEGSPDLWTTFQTALDESAVPVDETTDLETQGCRLDDVPPDLLEHCLRESVELVLISIRQDPTGIPPGFYTAVGKRIAYEHDLLVEALERGESLVPMLRAELEKARMPPMLHYVALIESGYQTRISSPAKAAGLWQFMPATARQYGLTVTSQRDDRLDPEKSTEAAGRYLRDLAFEFGGDALLLALAAYNRGENGVRRALKKLDDPFSDRSYWRLVEEDLLPTETSKYVTRFVAAAVAGEAGLPGKQELAEAGY